jgi:hypothetical protein
VALRWFIFVHRMILFDVLQARFRADKDQMDHAFHKNEHAPNSK